MNSCGIYNSLNGTERPDISEGSIHATTPIRTTIYPNTNKRASGPLRQSIIWTEFFTAPKNGFRDAEGYYSKTAGTQFTQALSVSTFLIHASDDTWVPVKSYEDIRAAKSHNSTVVITTGGGHVGFHEHGQTETRFDRAVEHFWFS